MNPCVDPRRGRLWWPLLAAILTLPTTVVGAQADDFDLSRHSIATKLIVGGGPPKDGIPAITDPRFEKAAAVSFLRDDDRIVGIAGPGGAKAYPIRILNWHEIVNDRIGERPIAVTYCPLTGSALVFDRRLDGETLVFGVSGKLYENNVLMYDRQSESLWSQLAAEAVTGPRTGTTLASVPAEITTWKHWREAHPNTLVLSLETGSVRDYHRNPYASYEASDTIMFPPSRHDSRLPAKELILGVAINGRHKAYPLSEITLAGGTVHDRISDRNVEVIADGRTATAHADGQLTSATMAYWFAWAVFHPDTAIWHFRMPKEEGPTPASKDIVVVKIHGYWSSITGPFVLELEPERDPFSRGGLYIVSGTIKNNSGRPVHHVRLRFDLLDQDGNTVYREEGFNRAAEAMIELERPTSPPAGVIESIVPIPPGGTDSYRMIFIGEELPHFEKPRVSVVSAE